MGYTVVGLKDKILELHPELVKHGVVSSLVWDAEKNAYVLRLTKGRHELSTYIDKVDADACMDGHKCVYLAVQVAQFIANFEEGE
jgi:hypothetical protein